MNWRGLALVTALIAVGNVALTLLVLWGLSAVGVPPGRSPGASMATQRLAEVYANEAFRYVITHDYAALNVIIRQTAAWPEVVYVSVEDPQGRILAHSDQARVGQVWTPETARSIRATVKVAYDEVVAVMSDPSGDARTKGPIGRVRLGFIADKTPQPVPGAPQPPLWAALAAALALAVPMGALAVRLGGAPAAPPEAEPEQVTRLVRDLKETAGEAERLRREQARQAEEVARLQRERTAFAETVAALEQELQDERAASAAALEQARGDVEALARERDDRAAEAGALRAALDGEGRAGPVPAAAAPGGGDHGSEAGRSAQHRAVAHICHAFRHSLTTILGFCRLLLRDDGGLDPRQRSDVETIQRAGDELLGFINILSELARADQGALPCRREPVALAALLVRAAQAPAVAGAVDVMLDPDDSALVEGDPAHVGRALDLLLQHAVADAREGPVVATARAQDATATVEVAYPRPPLGDDELGHLFEPFAAPGGGSGDVRGARLALARALVALNGGGLSVLAAERSVTFALTLPRSATPPVDGDDAPRSERGDHAQETARR